MGKRKADTNCSADKRPRLSLVRQTRAQQRSYQTSEDSSSDEFVEVSASKRSSARRLGLTRPPQEDCQSSNNEESSSQTSENSSDEDFTVDEPAPRARHLTRQQRGCKTEDNVNQFQEKQAGKRPSVRRAKHTRVQQKRSSQTSEDSESSSSMDACKPNVNGIVIQSVNSFLSDASSSDEEEKTSSKPIKSSPGSGTGDLAEECASEQSAAAAFVPTHVLFPQLMKLEAASSDCNTPREQAESKPVLELDVAQLLALGEAPDLVKVKKKRKVKVKQEEESEGEWEEVKRKEEAPKAVEVMVQLPELVRRRKKKQLHVEDVIKRRINQATRETQVLVHKVSLLCWLAHGRLLDQLLGTPSLLAAALSLVPSQHCYPPKHADLRYLESITRWFGRTVQLAGGPEPADQPLPVTLQSCCMTKQAPSARVLVLLFVCTLRSLGLQVRLVLNLQPSSLRPRPEQLCTFSATSKKPKPDKEQGDSSKKPGPSKAQSGSSKKPEPSKAQSGSSKKPEPSKAQSGSSKKPEPSKAQSGSSKKPEPSKAQSGSSKKPEPSKAQSGSSKKPEPSKAQSGSSKKPEPSKAQSGSSKKPEPSKAQSGSSKKPEPSKAQSGSSKKPEPSKAQCGSSKKPEPSKAQSGSSKKPEPSKAQSGSSDFSRHPEPRNTRSKIRKSLQEIEPNMSDKSRQPRKERMSIPSTSSNNKIITSEYFAEKSKYFDGDQKAGGKSKDTASKKRSLRARKPSKYKEASNDESVPSDDSDFEPEIVAAVKGKGKTVDRRVLSSAEDSPPRVKAKDGIDLWSEVYLEAEEKWISVDVVGGKIHCVKELYSKASTPVTYVLAFDCGRVRDVSRRYCPQFYTVTRKNRVDPEWWDATLKPFHGPRSPQDKEEEADLDRQLQDRPLPTSISEYKNHPLYVLRRHLLKFEDIYPREALPLGFIRGEPVFSRDCVFTLRSRETWVKEAKVVKPKEEPYKIVKSRPKYDRMTGSMVTDKPLEIFGPWQVQDYVPPEAKDGKVPRNEYGNVELFKASMLPVGTVHLTVAGLNRVAKKLQIDCAPAMVGFDYHCGGCHPVFDGFVVCEEFRDTLLDAHRQDEEERERRGEEKRQKRVYGNWRRFVNALLIRERLKSKYSFGASKSSARKANR